MQENLSQDETVTASPAPNQPASINHRTGKNRSIYAPLLLPIVTFGIYSLVWLYKIYSEAEFYIDRKVETTSGGAAVGFLFIPVFNIVWVIMLWFKTPGLLTKLELADGVPQDKVTNYSQYGWLLLLPVVGSIIWIILIQNGFNKHWDGVRARA